MQKKSFSDFREKAEHGDALLPVNYYCCHIPESYRNLTLHWHEEVEITYIEEGCANYTVNFEAFSVQKGDLLFLSPQILHGATESPGCTMTSHSLVFHLRYLGSLAPDICTVKYLNPILDGKCRFTTIIHPDHPGYPEMKKSFLDACAVFQKREITYELRMKALLFALFSDMYTFGCVEKSSAENTNLHAEERMKKILTYIQSNYMENLSIRELAGVCHFSETYFMNFFHKYAGTTCVDYINRYRLSKAAASLVETDTPVMEIALEHGFRNISYFNKLFKKQFGCTPREYRKNTAALTVSTVHPLKTAPARPDSG